MNPALNARVGSPSHVQVMNVLDVPQAPNTLEEFAMADFGLLEGIPGGMFDWGEDSPRLTKNATDFLHRTMGHVFLQVYRIRPRRGRCCATGVPTESTRVGCGSIRTTRIFSVPILIRIILSSLLRPGTMLPFVLASLTVNVCFHCLSNLLCSMTGHFYFRIIVFHSAKPSNIHYSCGYIFGSIIRPFRDFFRWC